MNRMRVSLAVAALGLAWGLSYLAPARAGDDRGAGQQNATATGSQRVEKLLQDYQSFRNRNTDDSEQTRKEIERGVKDLEELVRMRYEMNVALAEIKAEHAGKNQGQGHQPGQPAPNTPQGSAANETSPRETLNRELKALLTQLHTELQQAHTQTEQVATQLHALREGGQGKPQAANAAPQNKPQQGNNSQQANQGAKSDQKQKSDKFETP